MKSEAPGAFYESFFENTLDGLAYCQMLFDAEGHPVDFVYIYVNKNFEHLMGLTGATGKKVSELIPGIAKSNPELFEVYGRVSLSGGSERFESYVKPLNRWFLISVFSPKKEFFVAVFQNISERKQIEQTLVNEKIAARNVLEDLSIEKARVDAARAKEEAILLSIGEGLLATDEKGNITHINKAAEMLLGKKSEQVLGKYFADVIVTEDENGTCLPPEKHPLSMALAKGVSTSITTTEPTYYFLRKNKTKFPVAITATPILLAGKTIGAIKVFRDITREKEIDKAKSEFVSLASHQLRTPTTTVKWYAEVLLEEEVGNLNEQQKEYLNEIHHGNERMINLVDELLSVSRIELGTFTIEPISTNISKMLDDVLEELQVEIAKKKIEVRRKYEADTISIETDPGLVHIVFENLLSNAVDYTSLGGTVLVGFKKVDDGVHVDITDSGYGIPKDVQSKIYTKFFRADNARVIKPDGTGLGLYITKSITEALGGTLDFKSKEGEGTTFSVTIPSRGKKSRKNN